MSKEHAYAYEAGYRDGFIHYELEHCPGCKNVADLQETLAENVRLREELEAAKHDLQVFSMRSVQLDADNAKLQERVAELEELLPDSGRWYRAETVEAYVAEIDKLRKLVDYMAPIAIYGASEQERDRMRELGVEVSE